MAIRSTDRTYWIDSVENILNIIEIPLLIADEKENILGCNPSFLHITGYRKDDICVKSATDLGISKNAFHRALATKEASAKSPLLTLKKGKSLPGFVVMVGMPPEVGNIFLVFFHESFTNAENPIGIVLDHTRQPFSSLREAIAIQDDRGIYLQANREYAHGLGHEKPDDVEGKSMEELLMPKDAKQLLTSLKKMLEDHSPLLKVTEAFQATGQSSKHKLISNKYPVKLAGTTHSLLFTISNELTSQQKEKPNINSPLNPMSLFLDNLKDYFWAIDEQYTIIAINRNMQEKMQERFGFKVIPGNQIFDNLEESVIKPWRKIFERVLKGESLAEEFRMKLGTIEFYLELSGSPMILEDGKVVGAAFLAQGPVNNKIIQRAIRESEERFRQVAESMNDSIIMRSGQDIIYVNPAFRTIYGRIPGELMEHPERYTEWIYPNDKTRIARMFDWQSQNITSSFDEQYRILLPDQSVKWIWHRIFPIRNDEGQIYRYLELTSDISRHKKLEASLMQQKMQQKAMLDNIPHLAWMKDLEGKFISINESFSRYYKIGTNEVVGKTDYYLWDKSNADFFAATDKETIASGTRQLFEEVIETPNGTLWSETFKTPMFDENGNVTGIAGISIDITDRKRLEEELRISEERFRSLLQYSSDAINIVDCNGIITFESSLEGKISGFNITDLIGSPVISYVLEEDRELFRRALVEVIANPGKTVKLEFRSLRKDGSYAHVESIFANQLQNPQIQGIVINSRDITARKLAELKEKRYRENQSFLSCTALDFLGMTPEEDIYNYIGNRTLEIAGDAIVAVGVFNDQATTLRPAGIKGIEPYKLLVQPLLDMLQNESVIQVDEKFRHILLENSKHLYQFRGGLYEVFNWQVPREVTSRLEEVLKINEIQGMALTRQGKLYGAVIILMLNSKSLEEKQALETFLYQASIAIHRRQLETELVNAKERAEESDKIKTSFLANMSHEIRTPMNGILGFAQLLANENLNREETREYLNAIDSNGKLLISLIDDIIDISKIETGHVKIYPDKIHLNHFMADVFQNFITDSVKADKKEVRFSLETSLPNDDCLIEADLMRLRQIINNLISNAIKFTEKGFVKVGYTVEKPSIITFYVCDSGIGIMKEKQDMIFERFVQADLSITRKYGGSGLGLAISKGLVELMDGRIWVESEFQKGSSFYFSLPYRQIKEQITQKIDHHTEGKIKLTEKTVLVVEDDKFSFKYLEAILKRYEVNILHAVNGAEAVEMCMKNSNISLILMDIQLPNLSGYDATRQIRAIHKDIPIIAQTANAFDEDKQKCLEAGCNEYLAKPIAINTLISILAKYLF